MFTLMYARLFTSWLNFSLASYQWFAQHLSQMLVNPPLTEACAASQLSSIWTVTRKPSVSDGLLYTCAEASSVDKTRLDMEIDVSVDLVSPSYCGVRSQKVFGKIEKKKTEQINVSKKSKKYRRKNKEVS